MSVIYIREQGSTVKRSGERLIVTKQRQNVLEIPIFQVDSLAVMGNVTVTTQAMSLLMDRGIDINYFTYSGKYIGTMSSDSGKNIFLRLAQYELYQNVDKRLALARIIVANKADNQLRLISSRDWRSAGNPDYDWKKDADEIRKLKQKIPTVKNNNELMGIEGSCSKAYFSAFGAMLTGDFKFNGRNRRPPRDPVNILLSLGYTFLAKEVSSALQTHSFEMYLGFLHGIRYGRQSLPLDMMEEFRQPIVDRYVLNVCGKRIINSFDFDMSGELPALTDEGFKKFCVTYEDWLKSGENGGNRALIKKQAAALKQTVLKGIEYCPYSMGD